MQVLLNEIDYCELSNLFLKGPMPLCGKTKSDLRSGPDFQITLQHDEYLHH